MTKRYNINKIFESIITSRTRETFEVTESLIELGKIVGTRPVAFKQLYKAYRSLETSFSYTPVIGAPISCRFDYDKEEATLAYLDLSADLSLADFTDFMGVIDSVYSSIYPIGTVVELDLDLLPPHLHRLFTDGPGALVTITGRKLPVRGKFGEYIADYLARLWPFGELPGVAPIYVNNMMIRQVHQEGLRNDWEDEFTEDILRSNQLSAQLVSTAFMRKEDNAVYVQELLKEATHELSH